MVGETFDVYGILAEQCLGLATLDGKNTRLGQHSVYIHGSPP